MDLENTPKHKALAILTDLMASERFEEEQYMVPTLEFVYALMDTLNPKGGWKLIPNPANNKVFSRHSRETGRRYDYLLTLHVGGQKPDLKIQIGVRIPDKRPEPFIIRIQHFKEERNLPAPDVLCEVADLKETPTPSPETIQTASKFIVDCSLALAKGTTHSMGKTY